VAAAALTAGAFAADSGGRWLVIVLGVAAVTCLIAGLALSALRVSVDAGGLAISSRLLGFRFKTIPLGEIRDVRLATTAPGEWGGWGARHKGRDTAYIIRGRKALAVGLESGASVFITLPNPQEPAAVLRGLLVRH
jgi:hypothetical protein